MSKEEAQAILDNELDRIRRMSHQELLQTTASDLYTAVRIGPSGENYKICIKTKLKSRKKGLVRIKASVREAEGREVVKKIPILGIPITSYQVVGLMTILTIGPDDLN
ncbi:MAG: hypothetical protein ACYSWW_17620 [Planctomycetota bacterium]|jgi:hypothetical protein